MLTSAEIQAHLDDIAYYPNWTLHVQHHTEGPVLRMVGPLEDSTQPGTTVDLGINTFIPPIPDHAYLEQWLRWRTNRIGIHESQEWLRRKSTGKPLFDPHAEETNHGHH